MITSSTTPLEIIDFQLIFSTIPADSSLRIVPLQSNNSILEPIVDVSKQRDMRNTTAPQQLQRIVIGAGIGGIYSAFMLNRSSNQHTLLIEKHSDPNNDLSHQENNQTGSGDYRRGLRFSFQPPAITQAILATLEVLKTLPAEICTADELNNNVFQTQHAGFQTAHSERHPYLIGIENNDALQKVEDQFKALARVDSNIHYEKFTVQEVKQKFGIQFPEHYAAVINEKSAGKLNIKLLQKKLLNYLLDHNTQYKSNIEISLYAKLIDNSHLVQLTNGSIYRSKELVLATGQDFSKSLQDLIQSHTKIQNHFKHSNIKNILENNPTSMSIIPRLQQTIKIPLRAYSIDHIALDADYPSPTIYHMAEHSHGTELELFLFPKTEKIIDGKRFIEIKFGYDANHIRHALTSEKNNQSEIDIELHDIEVLLSRIVADTFSLNSEEVLNNMRSVGKQANCGYFFSLEDSNGPILGYGPLNILCVVHLQGWGAMALLGALKLFNEKKLDAQWNPYSKPSSISQSSSQPICESVSQPISQQKQIPLVHGLTEFPKQYPDLRKTLAKERIQDTFAKF